MSLLSSLSSLRSSSLCSLPHPNSWSHVFLAGGTLEPIGESVTDLGAAYLDTLKERCLRGSRWNIVQSTIWVAQKEGWGIVVRKVPPPYGEKVTHRISLRARYDLDEKVILYRKGTWLERSERNGGMRRGTSRRGSKWHFHSFNKWISLTSETGI